MTAEKNELWDLAISLARSLARDAARRDMVNELSLHSLVRHLVVGIERV